MLYKCFVFSGTAPDDGLDPISYIKQTDSLLLHHQQTRGPNIISMLVHRLRRCTNINTTVGQRLLFAVYRAVISDITSSPQQTRDIAPMLVERWLTACDAGPTLNQQCLSVWCFPGFRLAYVADYGTYSINNG